MTLDGPRARLQPQLQGSMPRAHGQISALGRRRPRLLPSGRGRLSPERPPPLRQLYADISRRRGLTVLSLPCVIGRMEALNDTDASCNSKVTRTKAPMRALPCCSWLLLSRVSRRETIVPMRKWLAKDKCRVNKAWRYCGEERPRVGGKGSADEAVAACGAEPAIMQLFISGLFAEMIVNLRNVLQAKDLRVVPNLEEGKHPDEEAPVPDTGSLLFRDVLVIV
ncbi:hypothetical protein N657DRAFT_394110 [Parathielavia appendiculata]|uniref:Uncharacterized protein n=1 Tax=Parathielavia appendiculata TaxID=2587402 RepID=A0AAN6Z4G1_9PEZI|nr:hypothetical protein N657DRAFT_394110 [Parathielavia appendiculata]